MDEFTDKTSLLNWSHIKFTFFSHKGRLNRRRYWVMSTVLLILSIAYFCLTLLMLKEAPSTFGWLMIAFGVILLIYISIMMNIKRIHDHDRKGHFLWLYLVPMANNWLMIELLFVKGTNGPNRFGEDPLQ